jgi:3',5'-cyclic AMP phosphodiesterase CpdA
MKRRLFVKRFGQGLSSSMFLPGITGTKNTQIARFEFQYPFPQQLEDAKNEEGFVVVRLVISGISKDYSDRLKGRVRSKRAQINRIKTYFNLGNNEIDGGSYTYNLSAWEGDHHIIGLWLEDVSEKSELTCKVNSDRIKISLKDLLPNNEFEYQGSSYIVRANLLFHNEVGTINPGDVQIPSDQDNFRFIIMADPQGGDPDIENHGSNCRMKIHNAFIEESILTANALSPEPVFTLVLGDFTDYQGEEENFRQMIRFFEKLNSPILLEIGNHESRYRAEFTPAYNMSELKNYFAAQKKVNGLEKLVYSFDIGWWHFIIWPDPLRNNFWETRPHYFDWLERDLEKNKDKPTFFFQHVPMHPIGINPLVSYVNPVHINRMLFDMLSRHGNVKYVFSGHVHIPIKSSLKTAVTYKGMHMINLPPAGYRPRAFGEEDLYGGPCQGMCIVDVKQEKAKVAFKTVTHEVYKYPSSFSDYSNDKDPLWFKHKWEFNPEAKLVNGSFEDGLKGWMRHFVYTEDENPTNLCEVRKAPETSGKALYMFMAKRGYDKPGQDRLPQTLNQLSQIVKAPEQGIPVIRFKYMVDKAHFDPESWNGGFLWVEGYCRNHLLLNHVYSIGKLHRSVGASYGFRQFTYYSYFDIYDGTEGWNDVSLNLKSDYDKLKKEVSYRDLHLEKIAISFGAWTINKGYKQSAGIYYKDVIFDHVTSEAVSPSQLNNRECGFLSEEKIWNRGTSNVAGEHQYVRQEEVYPF